MNAYKQNTIENCDLNNFRIVFTEFSDKNLHCFWWYFHFIHPFFYWVCACDFDYISWLFVQVLWIQKEHSLVLFEFTKPNYQYYAGEREREKSK